MMRPWNLAELEVPLEGYLIGHDCSVTGVSTDSRNPQDDALFVALCGEQFDGHEFLGQAQQSGAAAALVSCDVDLPLPLLRVADTQRALGKLGAYNRALFTGPLVAITGSSGKTTVKNMIAGVLSVRGETLATRGNLNNEIGVPLTLLELAPEHQYAVVEMGAGRRGDIAWLCELGRPSIALLLNAMPAHLAGFGSIEDVAAAKGEIFDNLGGSGIAVINADQIWSQQWRERAAPARIIDYGLEASAAIGAAAIESRGVAGTRFIATTPLGDLEVLLRLPGLHNVSNALAAIAVGVACELSLVEIKQGLESVSPVAGRLSAQRVGSGADIIDDCYNANPGSVRAAIDLLGSCDGHRTLILGAMGELGADSAAMHSEIGAYAKDSGLDQLWGVGPELESAVAAFGGGGRHFADKASAVQALSGAFASGDVVLIKGSRSTAMEQVLHALQNNTFDVEG